MLKSMTVAVLAAKSIEPLLVSLSLASVRAGLLPEAILAIFSGECVGCRLTD